MVNDTLLASKSKADAGSELDSDSEDDDFIPEPEPSRSTSTSAKVSKDRKKQAVDDASDEDSDEEASDNDEKAAGRGTADGEPIDADELEALKREREEMVAAAGGEDRLGKRRRLAANAAPESTETKATDDEAEALKAKAVAEWEAIKGSPSDNPASSKSSGNATASQKPQSSSSTTLNTDDQQEMIPIPTTYKFAGELHTSTRLLPRSHPDAIKYLSSQSRTTTTASSSSTLPAPTPRPPAPGPRRKKTSSLAALSAAATSKPSKLNTLEKSKLDWDSYKGDSAKLSQHERDELEHQTKGGGKGLGDMKGYLERRDFLDRVKDRTGQP